MLIRIVTLEEGGEKFRLLHLYEHCQDVPIPRVGEQIIWHIVPYTKNRDAFEVTDVYHDLSGSTVYIVVERSSGKGTLDEYERIRKAKRQGEE